MIVSWMLYISVVTLLLALAAWLPERIARQRGWPTRGLWVLALVASLLLPFFVGVMSPARESTAPALGSPDADGKVTFAPEGWMWWITPVEPLASASTATRHFDLDAAVLALWAIASALLALWLVLSYLALQRHRRCWLRQELDGHAVWVSHDTGPAVVGFLHGHIVIPEWLLRAGEKERALILAHEEEHLRAGDSRLVFGALLLGVALPWNLALWWIWRSLRRAVEIDCDFRVLAKGVDPRAYSRVLVEATERGTAHRFALAAHAESPSFLERRIWLMITPRSKQWWTRAAGAVGLAGACVVAACEVQAPGPLGSTTEPISEAAHRLAEPDSLPETLMRTVIQRYYPDLLADRVAGGTANLYVIADAQGDIVKHATGTEEVAGDCLTKIERRLGAFDPRAMNSAGCAEFPPGKMGPNTLLVYWAALKPVPGQGGARRLEQLADENW